jgi:hypothetical protein
LVHCGPNKLVLLLGLSDQTQCFVVVFVGLDFADSDECLIKAGRAIRPVGTDEGV